MSNVNCRAGRSHRHMVCRVSRPHGSVLLGLLVVVWTSSIVRAQRDPGPANVVQSTPRAPRFDCVPQWLGNDDKLTIRMSTPHGRDLAIRAPDRKLYFLVFWHASSADPEPIVKWEDFANLPELTLDTRGLLAPTVDSAGWHTPTRLFTKRGTYQVILGANLETEYEPSAVNTCRVLFQGVSTR
jgi:hypothetical protein